MSIHYSIKIAVCDDTLSDRELVKDMLARYLDKHDYLIGVDEYHSGEALLAADVTQYALVILDIIMGEINGIETAKKIIETHPGVQVIFCSTSNEYAAESYDVSALRYLTKPVSEEKLSQTLDRYFHAHTMLRTLNYMQNRVEESVYTSDILWIEADGHKSVIHTRQGDIVTRTSFSQLCEQLQGLDFVKPIRYAYVSLRAVAMIPSDCLTLSDGTRVPISRDQRAVVKKAFTDHKMKTLLAKGGVW